MAGEYKKIVIVTGGSSGIGRCTASALRDSGCIVYEKYPNGGHYPSVSRCDR